ncbi:MAG: sulfotransferase domain-containing protein, partial [Phaeodactylibacter sp.]|nr:sulfotransferase domain-containing protein [Phaeodactylibacter sp.]
YHYLKSHSQIFFPGNKEPHYFGTDLGRTKSKSAIFEEQTYLNLYQTEEAETAIYRGDASVFYLYSQVAAAQIAKAAPSAKILCLLRHPVDMMYSMFLFALRHGAEVLPNFEKALALEAKRQNGQAIPKNVFIEEMLHYRHLSNYLPQLERFYAHFPAEQIHVMLYDDLKNTPGQLFERLAAFLELDNEFGDMNFYVNKTENVHFKPSVVLNRKFPELMSALRRVLPSSLRQHLQFTKQVVKAPEEPTPLSAEFRQRLLEEKTPEIHRLASFLNRDLSHWLL